MLRKTLTTLAAACSIAALSVSRVDGAGSNDADRPGAVNPLRGDYTLFHDDELMYVTNLGGTSPCCSQVPILRISPMGPLPFP